jgi:hypothetical protein
MRGNHGGCGGDKLWTTQAVRRSRARGQATGFPETDLPAARERDEEKWAPLFRSSSRAEPKRDEEKWAPVSARHPALNQSGMRKVGTGFRSSSRAKLFESITVQDFGLIPSKIIVI